MLRFSWLLAVRISTCDLNLNGLRSWHGHVERMYAILIDVYVFTFASTNLIPFYISPFHPSSRVRPAHPVSSIAHTLLTPILNLQPICPILRIRHRPIIGRRVSIRIRNAESHIDRRRARHRINKHDRRRRTTRRKRKRSNQTPRLRPHVLPRRHLARHAVHSRDWQSPLNGKHVDLRVPTRRHAGCTVKGDLNGVGSVAAGDGRE